MPSNAIRYKRETHVAALEIDQVRKSYGAVEVLHDMSLDMEDGEFVALVGPSGCGKSTLLRMIAGLEDISSGEIRISGKTVNEVAPKNRDIAMVFQNYALYPHMTVAANMSFALRLKRASAAEIEERVNRAAQILGLGDLLDRHPRQLSGGQRQRVAMGRAIVRDPAVFLFDEPLSNLDAKLRVQMRTEIKDLHQRLKTTTVYVTHDQIEAMTLADRVVVMNDGVIEQIGTPLELYDRPESLFVAGFIGSPAMNMLAGTIDWENNVPVFRCGDGTPWPVPKNLMAERGQNVYFGVRPESINLGKGGLHLRVKVIEPTGAETLINARIGSEPIFALFHERLNVKPEEMIEVTVDPAQVHLFNADSGVRLN